MFSLIITIISIALVAALALATLYYGGNAFNKGSAEANASKIINEGQQINGAVQLFRADLANGTLTPTAANASTDEAAAGDINLNDVVGAKYLQQLPATFSAQGRVLLSAGVVKTAASVGTEVCKAVNVKAGFLKKEDTAADDTDAALVVAAADLDGKKVFGCDTATGIVQYAF